MIKLGCSQSLFLCRPKLLEYGSNFFFFNYAISLDAFGTYNKSDLWLYVSSDTNCSRSKFVMYLVPSFTQTVPENLIDLKCRKLPLFVCATGVITSKLQCAVRILFSKQFYSTDLQFTLQFRSDLRRASHILVCFHPKCKN